MPFVDFHAIRLLVPIEQALRQVSWHPTTTWGGTLRGQCPLGCRPCRCPPFQVQPSRRVWRCWRCMRHGDVLQLWALLHRMTVYEAARDLCRVVGVELPAR